MRIGGYDMAKEKYHHLYKRKGTYYFRKGGSRFSLETTVGTNAIKVRDKLIENYRMHGHYGFADQKEPLRFGEVAKEWAKIHEKKVKYSTWRDYRSAMNTHVLPAFKDIPIKDITYLSVEAFKADLECGAKRANNILVPMRSVFEMAHRNGYLSENVMSKVDNLSIDQPDIHPFTYEEVLAILNAVEPFYKPYTSVRFFTGMRSGEIDALEWTDYKASMEPNPKLHISKALVYGIEGKTKTKKSKRYIDCVLPVIQALIEQIDLTGKSEHIFLTNRGERINPDHFREVVWKPALEKAGLEYRPPIQTRHTFATMMLAAGEDIGWVQNMLGHSSLQMIFTRYYAWIPSKTRNDGSAFLDSIATKEANEDLQGKENQGKEISHVCRNDTNPTHIQEQENRHSESNPEVPVIIV
jgi:integrase